MDEYVFITEVNNDISGEFLAKRLGLDPQVVTIEPCGTVIVQWELLDGGPDLREWGIKSIHPVICAQTLEIDYTIIEGESERAATVEIAVDSGVETEFGVNDQRPLVVSFGLRPTCITNYKDKLVVTFQIG